MELMSERHSCYLCDSKVTELLISKDRNGKHVENYICTRCGFVMILPRPLPYDHESIYKKGGFSKEARGAVKPTFRKIKQVEDTAFNHYKRFAAVLSKQKIKSISNALEIGCGAGSFLRLLRARGIECEGIEPDYAFSQFGINNYNLDIFNGFYEDFHPKRHYDLIASFHVIEHVEDPDYFINKCSNLLSENGYLYLECPTLDFLYGPDQFFFFWEPHINSFSNKTLKFILEKNGFEIINLSLERGFVNVVAKKSDSKNFMLPENESFRIKQLLQEKVNNSSHNTNVNPMVYELYKIKQISKRWIAKNFKQIFRSTDVKPVAKNNSLTIAHVGFHHSTNAGDIALFDAVRKEYEQNIGFINWIKFDLHAVVTDGVVDLFNTCDALLVGGGGLFLKDTNENEISGWQWPIDSSFYKKIKVPIFIHAVGYNKFRGQENFEPYFDMNISNLVKEASFIGLRNKGSIESFKSHLPNKFSIDNIAYHPCPTTSLDTLYPNEMVQTFSESKNKTLAINIAFDRRHLRYGTGEHEDKIMNSIARVMKHYSEKKFKIVNLIHVERDEEFSLWLDKANVPYESICLINSSPLKIVETFRSFDIVIGTRGHAQMIPYGLNVSIISLISHDKLKYFLEDIEEQNRGIEISDPELVEKLILKIGHYIGNGNYQNSKLILRKQVKNNFKIIKNALGCV